MGMTGDIVRWICRKRRRLPTPASCSELVTDDSEKAGYKVAHGRPRSAVGRIG